MVCYTIHQVRIDEGFLRGARVRICRVEGKPTSNVARDKRSVRAAWSVLHREDLLVDVQRGRKWSKVS